MNVRPSVAEEDDPQQEPQQGATTTAATPPPILIAKQFIKHYYPILTQSPQHLHKFYHPKESSLTYIITPEDTAANDTSGLVWEDIKSKLDFCEGARMDLTSGFIDAQKTYDGGVLVVILGEMTLKKPNSDDYEDFKRKFVHTLLLKGSSSGHAKKKFFVSNDIFRFLDLEQSQVSNGPEVEGSVAEVETLKEAAVVEEELEETTAVGVEEEHVITATTTMHEVQPQPISELDDDVQKIVDKMETTEEEAPSPAVKDLFQPTELPGSTNPIESFSTSQPEILPVDHEQRQQRKVPRSSKEKAASKISSWASLVAGMNLASVEEPITKTTTTTTTTTSTRGSRGSSSSSPSVEASGAIPTTTAAAATTDTSSVDAFTPVPHTTTSSKKTSSSAKTSATSSQASTSKNLADSKTFAKRQGIPSTYSNTATSVYVRNVPNSTTREDLAQLFHKLYPSQSIVHIAVYASRGFAFIEFSNKEAVQAILGGETVKQIRCTWGAADGVLLEIEGKKTERHHAAPSGKAGTKITNPKQQEGTNKNIGRQRGDQHQKSFSGTSKK
jgi:hypothetical protein